MSQQFIGTGVDFPPKPGKFGQTKTVTEEDRIIANVTYLLGVRLNSIPGMEDVGSQLPDLPFSKIIGDIEYLKQSLLNLFKTFERRIIITDIPIRQLENGKAIIIGVKFKIKSLQSKEFTVDVE